MLTKRWKLIFEKQGLHYSLLTVLVLVTLFIGRGDGFSSGQFMGLPASKWLYLGIAAAVLHQVYVWFCWRTELHRSLLTKLFGQRAFSYYSTGFVILLAFRLLTLAGLAIANRNTLPASHLVLNVLAISTAIPLVYLFYSVKKYFGFKRALGTDHFDRSYRDRPLVKQGIFRYINNPMYTFGFLLVWIPGLLAASNAALLLALFSHLYIWVHYYFTERPDMMRIYGQRAFHRIQKGR